MVFREGDCQANRRFTSRLSLTLCSSDSTTKLKTNMVKPRKQRFHFIESDSDTDWTNPWTVKPDSELFCPLRMSKYHCVLLFWSFAVVLTEHTIWINYFCIWCALCFCTIMISYLVFFPCTLLIRNHMIFLVQFRINENLLIFSKTTNCAHPIIWCNFVSLWKNDYL